MKKRVGILTSGGDCPGLNATIRGVAKALYARFGENVEIVGILNGYHGLITGEYKEMCEDDFRGILTLGGTILGTKRTPFKLMRVVEEDKIDKVAAMKKTYKDAKLDCLLCLGGNGTHKTANLLSQEGLNIIGRPRPSTTTSTAPTSPSASTPPWTSPLRSSTASTPPPAATAASCASRSWATRPAG